MKITVQPTPKPGYIPEPGDVFTYQNEKFLCCTGDPDKPQWLRVLYLEAWMSFVLGELYKGDRLYEYVGKADELIVVP